MPFRARQWCSTRDPGFLWVAEVDAMPGVFLSGRDRYHNGRGSMRIELMSLVPLADVSGATTNQASMLRFLGEMVWYPSAALEPYVFWQEVDETSARATMCYHGVTASGVFSFDHVGNVIAFDAKRYHDDVMEDWHLEADPDGYQRLGDMRLPMTWRVSWRTAAGEWTWLHLTVDEIRYDGNALEQRAPRDDIEPSAPAVLHRRRM